MIKSVYKVFLWRKPNLIYKNGSKYIPNNGTKDQHIAGWFIENELYDPYMQFIDCYGLFKEI